MYNPPPVYTKPLRLVRRRRKDKEAAETETRLDAFEMKGLRKILRVSWTATKTNE